MRTLIAALTAGILTAATLPALAQEPPAAGEQAPATPATPEALRRRGTTRIEFDPRSIEGQTKNAGGIYLFQRKDAELKSLVARRKSFREEILKKLDE